jgi:hypothetical protein
MSHHPAITVGDDMVIDTAIRSWEKGDDRIVGHENCDLMVGQFSYPLVSVGCFGMSMPNSGCKGHHPNIAWMDTEWLRVLSYVMVIDDETEGMLRPFVNGCWTPRRMDRLQNLLKRQ